MSQLLECSTSLAWRWEPIARALGTSRDEDRVGGRLPGKVLVSFRSNERNHMQAQQGA